MIPAVQRTPSFDCDKVLHVDRMEYTKMKIVEDLFLPEANKVETKSSISRKSRSSRLLSGGPPTGNRKSAFKTRRRSCAILSDAIGHPAEKAVSLSSSLGAATDSPSLRRLQSKTDGREEKLGAAMPLEVIEYPHVPF